MCSPMEAQFLRYSKKQSHLSKFLRTTLRSLRGIPSGLFLALFPKRALISFLISTFFPLPQSYVFIPCNNNLGNYVTKGSVVGDAFLPQWVVPWGSRPTLLPPSDLYAATEVTRLRNFPFSNVAFHF